MKFYIFYFFLITTKIYAHPRIESRTNIHLGGYGSNFGYGGYGYFFGDSIDVTSEASAYKLGDFNCSEFQIPSQRKCESNKGKLSTLADQFEDLRLQQRFEETFKKLRLKALEYFALNLKAASASSLSPFDPKKLISKDTGGFCPVRKGSFSAGDNGLKRLGSPCLCSIPEDSDLYKGLTSDNSLDANTIKKKQKIIDQTMEPSSMLFAILARERSISVLGVRAKRPYVEKAHDEMPMWDRDVTQYSFISDLGVEPAGGDTDHDDDLNCPKFGRAFRDSSAKRGKEFEVRHNQCEAWGAELYRLETSFPHLYRRPKRSRHTTYFEADAEEADGIFDNMVSEKRDGKYVSTFKPGLLTGAKEIYEIMGGSWNEVIYSLRGRNQRGIEKFKKILKKGIECVNDSDCVKKLGSEGPKLKEAYAKYINAAERIKDNFADSIRRVSLPRLCKIKDKKQLTSWLFTDHPSVIRQLMIDLNPDERKEMRQFFCRNGFGERLINGNQCAGVSGGPLPGPNPVKVKRISAGALPFVSENNFEISQESPSAPRVLKLKVNLIPGPNLKSSEDIQKFAEKMKEDANKYFNCQFGNPPPIYSDAVGNVNPCPSGPNMKPSPRLKVDIDFNIQKSGEKPIPPFFYLHKCFRGELDIGENGVNAASDCKKVQSFAVRKCVEREISSGMNSKRAKEVCQRSYPLNSPNNNRANAANLTLGSTLGTIRHELFHQMGNNNDEYVDSVMEFNPIGEFNSLMNNSDARGARLYPRHVQEILSPLKCISTRLK